MKDSNKSIIIDIIPVIAMALFALTSLLNISKDGLSIAGIATILGALLFFVMIKRNKRLDRFVGLSRKSFIHDIRKSWLLIIMPSLINVICVGISKVFLPDYIDHVVGRTDTMITLNDILLLIIQFIIFAFLEEISWRGFMQKQLKLYTNSIISIIITSMCFAIGHASQGNITIVAYDVFFVFCNSIFYGIVFDKTKNAYVSATSHFIANLSGALIILFIL